MNIPRICIVRSAKDVSPLPCNLKSLRAWLESYNVATICAAIAEISLKVSRLESSNAEGGVPKDLETLQMLREQIANLKKQLPAITPHACKFESGRKASSAHPSGLVMLDIDHLGDVDGWWKDSPLADDLLLQQHGIALIHKTPSGKGLRIIAERVKGESLEDGQKRLAALFGFTEYDAVTKDLARLSFLVPAAYVYYMDDSLLEWSEEEADSWLNVPVQSAFDGVPAGSTETTGSATGKSSDGDAINGVFTSLQLTEYDGVAYSEIISNLISQLGGEPQMGMRNNLYFSLAVSVRYIADFNAALMLQIMPDFGLGLEERQAAIKSALGRPRRNELPDLVKTALAMGKVAQAAADEKKQWSTDDLPLPRLPRLLKQICDPLPKDYRAAMIFAALPVLGTLATRVRFNYLDGQEHSFSFFSCITAPAATGKSFLRKPIDMLLTPINEQDAIEREKEQKYKEELRKTKNKAKQPDDPHACPRNNGLNISIARLLQLMTYADGKHLFAFGEEIDTLVKSEKRGAWAQLSDVYRLAFDNATYGQQYMSDNSFNGNVKVYYNLLVTGTPGGMYRFFKDVEDGLVTRVCFASLPDMFATKLQKLNDYTEQEVASIIEKAHALTLEHERLECSKVDEAIDAWLEEKRQMALETDNRAIDTLRRRAGVIGFRAGYMFCLLNDRKNTKQAADFATWCAEYAFRNQMGLFGEQFENVAVQTVEKLQGTGEVKNLLRLLPLEFTKEDLITLRLRNKQSAKVHNVLSRWKAQGLIEKIGNGLYKKLK